jgi:hypothetical protein
MGGSGSTPMTVPCNPTDSAKNKVLMPMFAPMSRTVPPLGNVCPFWAYTRR